MLDPDKAEEKELFHYMTLFKHSIMEACSFLEEYQNNFYPMAEEEFKERVKFVRTAAKPILKKINEWKDLQTIRNELIAHPWRSKKGNEFSYKKIFTYNSPRNYIQLQFLRTYLTMMIGLIEAEFSHELSNLHQYMQSIQPQKTPPVNNPDIFTEMIGVITKVNAVCTANKKTYILDHKKIVGDI
ncbi:MAG: hypothetical protein ABL872_09920 [Lacibacter sp.]